MKIIHLFWAGARELSSSWLLATCGSLFSSRFRLLFTYFCTAQASILLRSDLNSTRCRKCLQIFIDFRKFPLKIAIFFFYRAPLVRSQQNFTESTSCWRNYQHLIYNCRIYFAEHNIFKADPRAEICKFLQYHTWSYLHFRRGPKLW